MDDVQESLAPDVLTAAVAQVRDADGAVLGTGFLVAGDLLITCAHVLADGGYGPGDPVRLVFPRVPGVPAPTGRVLEEGWRAPAEQDIGLVLLDESPAGTTPLVLGSAVGCGGHRVRSLGFPVQAPADGHFGSATVVGLLSAADGSGDLLQLTGANDLTTGFSGGPLLDESTGLVVGMVTSITAPDVHARGQGIAYATPTEVLRAARPSLELRDVSPYRGLEPFTAEHARWFRGREQAVSQLLAVLGSGQQVMLLLGPSGAGKSSLVQAGLLPALADGRLPGSDRWRQVVTRPGPELPTALAKAGPPSVTPGSDGASAAGPETVRSRGRVVLVIDQFEELLAPTTGHRDESLTALTELAGAIISDPAPEVVLVLVMRDDFYPRLSALAPGLLQAALDTHGVLNVPATLSVGDLEAIVGGPSDLPVRFEAGLAERIVSDTLALNPLAAQDSAAPVTVLPLLEVALSRLWERRLAHDGRLTHDAYRRIRGVTGALADLYGDALRELDEQQRNIARRALTALVRPADELLNLPAARQQLPLQQLRELAAAADTPEALGAVDEVLAVLSRHRVITTDRIPGPSRAGDAVGTPMVELFHDALVRDWPTLRRWVGETARFNDWLHRARVQQSRWQAGGDPQDLPTRALLAEGTDWSHHRRIPAELAAFLDAGRRHQQAAARRSRLRNTVLATFLALTLLASGLALWQRQSAVTAERTARAAQLISQSRKLASQSTALLVADSDIASLLAVAAYRTDPTAEAAAAVRSAAALPLRRTLVSPGEWVSEAAFSPDGRTLATADNDGRARLWDVTTGRVTAVLVGTARAVAFSPDGRLLATAADNNTTRLWDVATGATTTVLAGHTNDVVELAFSPDGRTLATASWDHTARLWDVATGATTAILTGHTNELFALAFSPDGRTLATGSYDRTVRLWDVTTGRTTAVLTGHANDVFDVAFSPDGRTLASAGRDHTTRLWDVASHATTAVLTGHTSAVDSVAFSPDGRTLATTSHDHTARLWELATGRTTAVLTGHTEIVTSVAFSPDGRTLATAGSDGTARLWNVATTTLTGHTRIVRSVVFSPDGRTLASTSDDNTVRLWDAATGRTTAVLTGPTEDVLSAVFTSDSHTLTTTSSSGTTQSWDVATGKATATTDSRPAPPPRGAVSPDGRTVATIVTADQGDTVRLWDAATGATTAVLTGHTDTVHAVVFGPDGRTLATAGRDRTVRLWDAATGRTTAVLTGHTEAVNSVAFSPDGHTLATAADDHTARLWDVATGTTTATFTGHTGDVNSVAFSPDGRALATAGGDLTVRLWTHLAPDAAVTAICEAVGRDLSPTEKAVYLPPDRTDGSVCPAGPEGPRG
ncbi:nSTAND1 domain-containing NTPase [Kitasatospora sp. NPDC001664]